MYVTILHLCRIAHDLSDEEHTLVKFFGDDYRRYRAKVPTRIPFIR